MGRKADAATGGKSRTANDRIEQLRVQWIAAGFSGDMEFAQFTWGVTIVGQLIEREFKRFVTAKFGLSPGDVRILLALWRAGPDTLMRPSDLFRSLLVTSGAITKQLDRLEARGLVRREHNAEDKRGSLVRLTGAGKKIAETPFTREKDAIIYHAFHALNKTQRAQMVNLFHLMVQDIERRTEDDPID